MRPRRAQLRGGGHPDWCARDHACTAPVGPHRSDPVTWRAAHGVFVATRVQEPDGRQRLEIRVVVDLAADEGQARVQARQVAAGIDLSVYAALLPGDVHNPFEW